MCILYVQFFVQWWMLKWEGMYPWVCTQYCNALCSGHLTSSTHIWSASLKTSLYVYVHAQTQRGCSGCWQAEVAVVMIWDFNIGNSIKQSSRQLPSCFLLSPSLLNVGGVILYYTAWPRRQFPCVSSSFLILILYTPTRWKTDTI